MSADVSVSADLPDEYRVPEAKWERTSTGGRLSWWPRGNTTKIALFRTVTDDGVTVLQHVREIVSSQRGETRARIDDDPELDDVPAPLLRLVEGDGLTVATEGHR
jgi:hypothetical protein